MLKFDIEKRLKGGKARAGKILTPHGVIHTPAFIVVGTKATVKGLSPEQVASLGAEAVLANTYHLYLEPGEKVMKDAGGLHKFMNWPGPTFTDSGGFQAFSLGAAFNNKASKIAERTPIISDTDENPTSHQALAQVDNDGVDFKSVIDGSSHRFTPERSMEIQHAIGADIIFAFDECTSPHASYEYQKEAMDRTHAWAKRSLEHHKTLENKKNSPDLEQKGSLNPESSSDQSQAIFGIVQGGRFEDLRKQSAQAIGAMDFDGFGIGGSFDKEDIYSAVGWVNEHLPEGKPRHLLGIGEPEDLFGGVENGVDTFDCVAPTRIARNGSLYTHKGKINILNSKYREDVGKIDPDCGCTTCRDYTPAYLSHLFRAKEMQAATLASIHNLYFIVNLVKKIRASIIDGTFGEFKEKFLKEYLSQKVD